MQMSSSICTALWRPSFDIVGVDGVLCDVLSREKYSQEKHPGCVVQGVVSGVPVVEARELGSQLLFP